MSTDKLKALVHYLVYLCRDNPGRLGSIRLNKSLWFTDVIAYHEDGRSVTGARYVRRAMGPVPAAILPVLNELSDEGKLLIQRPRRKFQATLYYSLKEPDVSLLSGSERELARSVLDSVLGISANEISDITHDEVWEAAAEGEEIPMHATLASGRGEITPEVRQWAQSVIDDRQPLAA